MHAVALAHAKLPGHGAGEAAALQVPEPLHRGPGLSTPPEQAGGAPQGVELAGKRHAPVPSQSVAPQGAVVEPHAEAQQCPEPDAPQTPLAHWSTAVQRAPLAFWGTQLGAEQ